MELEKLGWLLAFLVGAGATARMATTRISCSVRYIVTGDTMALHIYIIRYVHVAMHFLPTALETFGYLTALIFDLFAC